MASQQNEQLETQLAVAIDPFYYTVKQFRMAEIYNFKSVVKNQGPCSEQSTKYWTYACKNEDI